MSTQLLFNENSCQPPMQLADYLEVFKARGSKIDLIKKGLRRVSLSIPAISKFEN